MPKVSDGLIAMLFETMLNGRTGISMFDGASGKGGGVAYGAVDDLLVPRVVVDVHRHAAQRGDFRCELVEARVVLPVGSFARCQQSGLRFSNTFFLVCGSGLGEGVERPRMGGMWGVLGAYRSRS